MACRSRRTLFDVFVETGKKTESQPQIKTQGGSSVKVLSLLRADEHTEAGEPPSPELMERMGAFVEKAMKAGVLVHADGVLPSAKGKRVRLSNGRVSVVDGPFTESKELVSAYAVMEAATMDEVIDWTRQFLEVLGGGECELRPIFDPAD